MNSTRAPLTQLRQEAIANLFPGGRLYFPGIQRCYPRSDLLAPSVLDIGFWLRFQALPQHTCNLSPFLFGQSQRFRQHGLSMRSHSGECYLKLWLNGGHSGGGSFRSA